MHPMHKDKWRFVSLLRDLVSRWILEYVYNTFKSATWKKNELTVEEYMATEKDRNTCISYLRYFSNMPTNYRCDVDPFVDEAIVNFNEFSVSGVVENLDEWRRIFSDTFGVTITVQRLNTTPNVKVVRQIRMDKNLMHDIEQLCEPDMRIYHYFAAKHQ